MAENIEGVHGQARKEISVEIAGDCRRDHFFLFMALLPKPWEEGDDVPAPNPTIEGG